MFEYITKGFDYVTDTFSDVVGGVVDFGIDLFFGDEDDYNLGKDGEFGDSFLKGSTKTRNRRTAKDIKDIKRMTRDASMRTGQRNIVEGLPTSPISRSADRISPFRQKVAKMYTEALREGRYEKATEIYNASIQKLGISPVQVPEVSIPGEKPRYTKSPTAIS